MTFPSGGAPPDLPGADTVVPVHLNRDFRVLWLVRTLGQTGANTAQFGSLIIIAESSWSGFVSSLLVLAWVVPPAIISILSGVVVDAVPKRWLLAVANAVRAAAAFFFLTSAQGETEVFVLVLALSAMGPFIGPAESALVPTLVRRSNLTSANALLNFMRYVAQVAGLAILAPLLTHTSGVDALVATTGVLFSAAAVYAALIPRGRYGQHPEFPDEVSRPRQGGLRVAIAFMRERRDVWQAAVQLALMAATLPLIAALIPLYLATALDQRVSDLPVVAFPAVAGMVLGLRFVSGIARQRDTGWLSKPGLSVFTVSLALLAFIDGLNETLGVALDLRRIDLGVLEISAKSQIVMMIVFPMGFAFSLMNVAAHAILNARVPVRMQGRIFSLQMVLAGVAAIPPLLAVGALTEVLDVRVVLGMAPLLLVGAWFWSPGGGRTVSEALQAQVTRRRSS